MKFYRLGRRIKDIDELNSDELFSVCGVAGKIRKINEPNGTTYTVKAQHEKIVLALDREALLDRIHFGMVYRVQKEFTPRAKTIAKML